MSATDSPRHVPLFAIFVALIAGGIVSFGAGASPRVDVERDRALQAADPNGGTACDRLHMSVVGGIGSFADAQQYARNASTTAIRTAADPEAMRRACVDAGANMSED